MPEDPEERQSRPAEEPLPEEPVPEEPLPEEPVPEEPLPEEPLPEEHAHGRGTGCGLNGAAPLLRGHAGALSSPGGHPVLWVSLARST